MAKSMLAVSDPGDMANIQRDIEMGFLQAEMMEDALDNLVDMSENMLNEMVPMETDKELLQIMQAIQTEADAELQGGFGDAEMEASLRAIEEQ
ncbi:hypothetical protein V6O07_09575, partial [Arthrospira platensis SPKY2]